MNPRQGKIPYTLWLTEEEANDIEKSLNKPTFAKSLLLHGTLLQIKHRGDYEKMTLKNSKRRKNESSNYTNKRK